MCLTGFLPPHSPGQSERLLAAGAPAAGRRARERLGLELPPAGPQPGSRPAVLPAARVLS